MVQFLLGLHLFTISWSSVLKASDWMPLPLVIFVLATFCVFIEKFWKSKSSYHVPIRIERFDLLIVLALLLMMLSALFIPTSKAFNYVFAYSSVFLSYLVFIWLSADSIKIESLLRAVYYGVNFISIFIIAEVAGRLIFGRNIFEWIPRVHEATATVTPGLFRAYGLSSEPTHVGNYFCCFAPFSVYYARLRSIKYFSSYIFFLAFAALLTFSGAMFAVFAFSGFLLFVLVKSKKEVVKTLFYTGLMFLVSFFVLITFFDLYELVFGAYETVFDKLSLTQNSTSVNQRVSLLDRGINDVSQNPIFGTGLGSASSNGLPSTINWYLFLGAEAGLIILFLYVAWFSIHLVSAIINYKTTSKSIYLASVVSISGGMAYLMFLSTFQNLYLLTSILLYRLILKSNSRLSTK
tara:strand:+ start:11271 stop:12491 length:1221 start_codon:yes stop_codon:yes gene_type:complete